MGKKNQVLLKLVILLAAVLVGLVGAVLILSRGNHGPSESTPEQTTTEATTQTTTEATTQATTQATTVVTEPDHIEYTLSFVGDCTLGTDHSTYGNWGSFVHVVGNNYDYPFADVKPYFENDDFSMINLEVTFTDNPQPSDIRFRFRGPFAYSKILSSGGVEAATIANNHAYDFGGAGYRDTKASLESEGIAYVEEKKTAMYTTESGLKIGLFAAVYYVESDIMTDAIAKLRQDGAELVIVAFHWGEEGSYRPTDYQKYAGRLAIDAGADIVYGHHPHVLQPIEQYKDGVIYYSLGNFSFGGNTNPRDKDSVVVQQKVIRDADGSIRLGETVAIPFCLSSTYGTNDYKPTPYDVDNPGYQRAMSKLDGTFEGPDLVVDYTQQDKEQETTAPTTEETQPSVEDTTPTEEETQPSVEDTTPTEEETQPSVEETDPVEEETQPSVEQTTAAPQPEGNDPPAGGDGSEGAQE